VSEALRVFAAAPEFVWEQSVAAELLVGQPAEQVLVAAPVADLALQGWRTIRQQIKTMQ